VAFLGISAATAIKVHGLFIFSLTINIHQGIVHVKRKNKRDVVLLMDIDRRGPQRVQLRQAVKQSQTMYSEIVRSDNFIQMISDTMRTNNA